MTTQFDIALQNLMEAFLAGNTLPEKQRYNVGTAAEKTFHQYALKAEYDVTPATSQQDKDERWDFDIQKLNGKYNGKIDVKASRGTFKPGCMYVTLINNSGYGEPFFRNARFIAVKEEDSGPTFFRMFRRMTWALKIQKAGKFTIFDPHSPSCMIIGDDDNNNKYEISAYTDTNRYPKLFTDKLNESRLFPTPIFYKDPQNTIGVLVPMDLADWDTFE